MEPTQPLTALQRVQGALDRLSEVDARTGCLAHRDDEQVLAQVPAHVSDELTLAGEPFTVKDWIDVADFPCCGGDPAHRERRPQADATAVARLRAAGGVVVAKTAALVDSPLYGPVRHPRDPSLSPGGSSSGDAAAVGAGAVRLGIGSDSGGSVRLPAAWCGIVGMKPSAGLVPTTGHFPRVGDRSDGRTVLGPLASSVDLAWRAVSVMAGPDGRDGAAAPAVVGQPQDVDVAALRICIGSPGDAPVADEVQEALSLARATLLAAGARDAGAPPDWLDEALRVTQAYWRRGSRTGAQVEQDLVDWDRFRRRAFDATRDVDVLVTPTVGSTAPTHRAMRTEDYLFCLPASLTGAPAVSVPVGAAAVQVVAHRWADHVAVAVARLLESAAR